MDTKSLPLKALLLILLIISIPISISGVLAADYNIQARNATEQAAYDQCISGAEKIEKEVKEKAEQYETIEIIAGVLYVFCTVMNAITQIFDIVANIIGFASCCRAGLWSAGSACAATSAQSLGISGAFAQIVRPICSFVNNGWCGFAGDLIGAGFDVDEDIVKYGNQFGSSALSSFDSQIVAMFCLNIVAMLYHMKNLNKIKYQEACCIRNACEAGQSTEHCHRNAQIAKCVYIDGGNQAALARLTIVVAAAAIAIFVAGNAIWPVILDCIRSIYEIIQIPNIIQNAIKSFDYISEAGGNFECDDSVNYGEGVIDPDYEMDLNREENERNTLETTIDNSKVNSQPSIYQQYIEQRKNR